MCIPNKVVVAHNWELVSSGLVDDMFICSTCTKTHVNGLDTLRPEHGCVIKVKQPITIRRKR